MLMVQSYAVSSFNPRTYMRCDRGQESRLTHNNSFNPRTYMRCDLMQLDLTRLSVVFQSTHLHEVRRLGTVVSDDNFNVSIHAPT